MQASTHECACVCIHTQGTLTGEWRSRRNGIGDRLELPAVYVRAYLSLSLRLESFLSTNSPEFLTGEQVICIFFLEMVTRDL